MYSINLVIGKVFCIFTLCGKGVFYKMAYFLTFDNGVFLILHIISQLGNTFVSYIFIQVNKLSFEVKRENLSGGPPTVTHLGINPLEERMSPDSLMAINYASNLHKQANFSPNPPGLMRTKHILCITTHSSSSSRGQVTPSFQLVTKQDQ